MSSLHQVLKAMGERDEAHGRAKHFNYPKIIRELSDVEHLLDKISPSLFFNAEVNNWLAQQGLKQNHDLSFHLMGDEVTFYFAREEVAVEFKLTFM